MKLENYLKQFDNIVWYPSANKDVSKMYALNKEVLLQSGIPVDDVPDCFIHTDYLNYDKSFDNPYEFEEFAKMRLKLNFGYENSEFRVSLFNIKRLENVKVNFNRTLVDFDKDKFYESVFAADVLLDHPLFGVYITKLIYVFTENSAFAFNFLLRKNIKVKYVIRSCYGVGFGGGKSTGGFLLNVLKDLGTKYFLSDFGGDEIIDLADKYLNVEQKSCQPVLRKIDKLDSCKFYKVVDFDHKSAESNIRFKIQY